VAGGLPTGSASSVNNCAAIDDASCQDNEYDHLFTIDGVSSSSPGLFENVQSSLYWSGLEYAPNPSSAWYFNFSIGSQNNVGKNNEFFA